MTDAPDPITVEVLASALRTIAHEMAVVEYRSSFSPIIREMLDFNCGLFDAAGRLVADSEQIPAQLGLMQFALEAGIARWGDAVAPGDAILTNHPYMGGTHTPDLQVFRPAFHGDRLVGWAGSIAHHIDIGGTFPGTESAQTRELFHEGMIFPAIKLVEAGRRVRAVYDLLGANVRAEADVRSVPELAKLTSREWEVLRGLVAHQRVPTIARRLNIQASTVRNHLKSIYAKLDVHSQQELLERVVGVPDAAAG